MKDYDLWGAGPNTLVLPVCRNNHWVTLVARLGENPLMVLLNSLSGGPTIITIEAELFRDFLLSHTSSSGLVFTFVTPLVPQQPNFQDCGLFAIKYAELVISDPKKFFQIVTDTEAKQQLSNWFSYYEMENKRGEMAEIIRNLAEEQRREGGPLYGEDLEIPSMDFSKVKRFENLSTNAILFYIFGTGVRVGFVFGFSVFLSNIFSTPTILLRV